MALSLAWLCKDRSVPRGSEVLPKTRPAGAGIVGVSHMPAGAPMNRSSDIGALLPISLCGSSIRPTGPIFASSYVGGIHGLVCRRWVHQAGA